MNNNKGIVFGTRPVLEVIKSEKEIEKIFIQKNTKRDILFSIISLCKKKNVNMSFVPKEKFVSAWLFVCSLLLYVTEILIEQRLVIWNSKWKRIVMLVCNLPFKPSTFNQCF